jgi:sirohydrochlorin ferrochelatase
MSTAILLVAHGSPVAAANADLLRLVEIVRERSGYMIVEPAFLEGASPSIPDGIETCVRQGAGKVAVIPYFLLPGRHVAEDLPAFVAEARARHPYVTFVLGKHLGYDERLVQAVADRIREGGM